MSASIIASQPAYLLARNDDCDFPLYPEAAPQLYSPDFYHINMQGYDMDASAYGGLLRIPIPQRLLSPARQCTR
jgi:hypothetical protein